MKLKRHWPFLANILADNTLEGPPDLGDHKHWIIPPGRLDCTIHISMCPNPWAMCFQPQSTVWGLVMKCMSQQMPPDSTGQTRAACSLTTSSHGLKFRSSNCSQVPVLCWNVWVAHISPELEDSPFCSSLFCFRGPTPHLCESSVQGSALHLRGQGLAKHEKYYKGGCVLFALEEMYALSPLGQPCWV